jgi:hypothetical protein
MKHRSWNLALGVLNAALLIFLLTHGRPALTQASPAALQAQRIELVDNQGVVRAQLTVEESGETVFRMRDAKGEIRVKLGASETGSGLLLNNGATEPGVHALAQNGGVATITLHGKGGIRNVLAP